MLPLKTDQTSSEICTFHAIATLKQRVAASRKTVKGGAAIKNI